MKRVVLIVVVVALGLGVAALPFVFSTDRRDDLTSYLGEQVFGVVNSYLRPDFAAERVTYRSPSTLTLSAATMTAPDGTEVLRVGTLTIELASVPRVGRPIEIASLTISDGELRLIRDASIGEGGGFKGFGEFAEPEETRRATDEQFRLSTVLRLERVALERVKVVYDDGGGGEPLVLDGLSADLATDPEAVVAAARLAEGRGPGEAGADAADAGWHDIDLRAGRSPGLTAVVDGRLNLDTFMLELASSQFAITLDESTRGTLPSSVASLLEAYKVRGAVEADASGMIPLTDPAGGEMTASVRAGEAFVQIGDLTVPVTSGRLEAGLRGRVLSLSRGDLDAFGGQIRAAGSVDLNDDRMPAGGTVSIADVELAQLLATADGGDESPLAGIVAAEVSAAADLADAGGTIGGSGTLDIGQGRFVVVPVISDLAEVMELGGRFESVVGRRHSFKAAFDLEPRGVVINRADLRTPLLGASFDGVVEWGGGLALDANAGLMKRVQQRLGEIGDLIGLVTDRLVTYRIDGTVGDPRVRVRAGR